VIVHHADESFSVVDRLLVNAIDVHGLAPAPAPGGA
jgi:hypothetical protein